MNSAYSTVITDVLVIGAGGAGLRAAIEVAKRGASVLLLGKEVLGCAHTGMAMGGMNVALNPPATPKLHYQDTMAGGWYINDPKLVKVFTEEMPQRIYDLEDYGLLFDRTDEGKFYTWKGGKQSAPLNVCVGDYTGREMMQALVDQTRKLTIPYRDEFFVTSLFKQEGRVKGALGIDLKSGEYVYFRAKAVILATGGAGRMYKVTTNAASNTGDGYAMALSVGATLIDMEMTQFHPTGMVFPESARGVLVTEKVRGHGGRLFNSKKERFMSRYQPERMELAGRDEVAMAIYTEVREGRGTKNGGVYLDVTHWPKGEVEEKIPDVFEQYLDTGVDIRRRPMEIYPTMHHVCGGVRITVDGETTIPGLFAVGEVAGGVHGANRLGGNSIAEGQVFGRRAGIAAAKYSKKLVDSVLDLHQSFVKREIDRVENLFKSSSSISVYAIEDKLKELMWNKVGLVRDEKRLLEAEAELRELVKLMNKVHLNVKDRKRNKELQDALEVANMLLTAQAIITAAICRRESRGAHTRSDYPKRDEKWKCNLALTKKRDSLKVKKIFVNTMS